MKYSLMELVNLPIIENESVVRFIVPIHSVFLRSDISLDPNLANEIFPEAKIEAQRRLPDYDGIIDSCYERPSIRTDDRGFAKVLTTNGGIYASLFFNIETPYKIQFYRNLYTGLKEKLDSYRDNDQLLYGYDRHNVDSLVQATMLQTWAVMYLNRALQSLK